ncbi:dihydrofolate reductase family protein [Corynebacterium gerontici]|uniref:5-amino-6-(5-phosphoribosylamino)uracil reductase n=1 Tax=Corynebacterium gerontici TaxID=2079234 RepID=A0A3G6J185_9CORY|nr:dihydrofolate reductase family protein [Corynebacterium gerontici]AZA11563.1 5-amino-6-(5-phosphoribosylamino)uracil reductase [Corynebacterium gerontici]
MSSSAFSTPEAFAQHHLGPDNPKELRLVCISSIGGASTIDGVSGPLGNDEDSSMLKALRDWADAVLVTAATAQAERYTDIQVGDRNTREARNQRDRAQLILLSESLEFSVPAKNFSVLSPYSESPTWQQRAAALEASGHQVFPYRGEVANAIRTLHHAGFGRIVCEGGPWLYTALVRSGCVDKLFYTLSPTLLAPIAHPLFQSASEQGAPLRLELEALDTTSDGTVFLRYRNSRRVSHE